MAARSGAQRPRRASRRRDEAEQESKGTRQESQQDDAEERDDDSGQDDRGGGGGVFSELKDVASEAALSVLAPVAKQAATTAAKFAVKKGPELMENTILPKLEDAGGAGGLLESAKGLMPGGLGGGDEDDEDGDGKNAGDGTGKGRRMPIQQSVDVAAPIDIVYDQFTQFEDYPKFMHRVERVEQKDDVTVAFDEKIWGIRRHWEAEIVEQRPDERIVWESVSGMEHVGVVTFHELAERLTRIELNIDIDPSGPIEKIARGARFAKRAARADLKRFKAYVEMHEDATGEWRGEIEDGEVVDEEPPEDEAYEEEYEDEAEAEYDEEEPEQEEDEEPEEEEKPKPRKRQPARSRSSNGNSGSASKSSGSKSTSRSKSRASSKSSNGSSGSSRSRSSSSRSKSSSNGSSKSSGGTQRKSRAKSSSRS